ncbi:MAG: hypothetical protein U0V48_04995 [Anaerolineales bacterium]
MITGRYRVDEGERPTLYISRRNRVQFQRQAESSPLSSAISGDRMVVARTASFGFG